MARLAPGSLQIADRSWSSIEHPAGGSTDGLRGPLVRGEQGEAGLQTTQFLLEASDLLSKLTILFFQLNALLEPLTKLATLLPPLDEMGLVILVRGDQEGSGRREHDPLGQNPKGFPVKVLAVRLML